MPRRRNVRKKNPKLNMRKERVNPVRAHGPGESGVKKPTCTCGTCNVCKTRDRMRKLRQTNTVNEAKSDHVRATGPATRCPKCGMAAGPILNKRGKPTVEMACHDCGHYWNPDAEALNERAKKLVIRDKKDGNPWAVVDESMSLTKPEPLVKSTPAFNQRVRWLLACPSGDVNFRTNLEKATLEELEYVQKRYNRSSFKSKDGTRRINAQLNRLRKAQPPATGPTKPSPVVMEGLSKLERMKEINPLARAAVIDNSKGRPELETVGGAAETYAENMKKHVETAKRITERDMKTHTETAKRITETAKRITGMQVTADRRAGKTWAMAKALEQKMNGLSLWVNGGDKLNYQGLEEHVKTMRRIYGDEIYELTTRINQHHMKTIKGNNYWYSKYRGEQKYHGKTDPRPELESKVIDLEKRLKDREAAMRAVVIKRIGKHIVVDQRVFNEQFKKARVDMIPVGEMIA